MPGLVRHRALTACAAGSVFMSARAIVFQFRVAMPAWATSQPVLPEPLRNVAANPVH